MARKELKWYDIFFALLGTILSFADPITDILTLVEFYHAGQATGFVLGLCFIILPCLFCLYLKWLDVRNASLAKRIEAILFFGHPFFPALLNVGTLISYLKKLWRSKQIQPVRSETTDEEKEHLVLVKTSNFFLLFEAFFESAPQFIIQLYVVVVQQESVTIVQIISLPVSLLSLARAAVMFDEIHHYDDTRNDEMNLKHKLLHFATHVLLLGSRLSAIALFAASHNGFVATILFNHFFVIFICDALWLCCRDEQDVMLRILSNSHFYFHWLRDDTSMIILAALAENRKRELSKMMVFSNALFMVENFSMILLYLGQFSHTWYSLPVTICVCLFTVLGAIMRLTHFYFLERVSHNQVQENIVEEPSWGLAGSSNKQQDRRVLVQ